jgi:hypothetical protein
MLTVLSSELSFSVVISVHADVSPDVITLLDVVPPFPERRPIQGHATADNGHEATAGLKTPPDWMFATRVL